MKNITDKSDLELVPQGERAVARPAQSGVDIESLFRYAIEKGGGVDAMNTLMAVRRELNAEKAKRLFDDAMAAFQAECPVITKTKGVSTTSGELAYKYTPFEEIIAAVKPLLQKHGFSYSLDTDTTSQDGWVIATCKVTHKGNEEVGGHCETSRSKFPLGGGTRMMSATQIYAATLTFASRRVFCNVFGIVTSGEDADGGGAKEKGKGPSSLRADSPNLEALRKELWNALEPVRGDKPGAPAKDWKAANDWLWKEEILDPANPDDVAPKFSAEKFRIVIEKVKAKLAAK